MPLPDLASASTYLGPVVGKVNYTNLPPSDPNTDFDNTLITPAFCDVAALGLTAFKVAIRMTLAATTGALVLNSWNAIWKNATSTAPVLARTGTGIFTITMPTVVSDEYNKALGVSNNHTVNLTMGQGNIENVAGFIGVACSTNVITVKTFNAAGNANDLAGDAITIFAY